jgi:CheY-like chemotaxis protein
MSAADAWYEIVFPPLVTLAVVCLAAILLWLVRVKLAEFVSQLGVQKVSAFGVDLQFVEHQATAAYTKQGLDPPSEDDKAAIRDAVQFLAPLAAQSRILWVDDNPGGNTLERSTLLSWEVDVQAVRTTDEALRELGDSAQRFDLVLSDWQRPNDAASAPAGLQLIKRMRDSGLEQSVIFYHGLVAPEELAKRRRDAREAGAAGATGSPGELFRWTLIELARIGVDRPNPIQRQRRERLSLAVPLDRG